MDAKNFNTTKCELNKKLISKLMILLIGFSTLFTTSCINDEINQEPADSMDEMSVPDAFTWETSATMVFDIDAVSSNPGFFSGISVFTGDPQNGGELIMKGSSSEELSFTNEIEVPADLEKLFVLCEFPSGNTQSMLVDVTGDVFKYTFNELTKSTKNATVEIPVSPDCNSGCSETITSTSGNIVVSNKKTICLTGNFTGDVTFQNNGGTLRICGNTTLRNINFNGNLTVSIEITASGSLQTTNLNLNKNDYKITNWGVLNISNNFSPNGILINYGTVNVSGYNVNQGGKLKNFKTMNVAGDMNNNALVENSGALNVSGHFNNNSSGTINNNCKLIVTGNFNQNAKLANLGYVYSGGTFTVNSGAQTELTGGAMIKTKNLMVNSKINGIGNYSGLSVSGSTVINSNGSLTGQLDICDENGIETKNGTIAATVKYCETYIPVSDCNPVGIGEPSIPDSDHDGIPDDQDEYPDDNNSAFNSYFPGESTYATLLFEDLWPGTGDYDFNDLVAEIKGAFVTNASNKVVSLKFFINVKAVGASGKNGLGIQFDNISSSAVTSVNGAVYKSGSNIALNSNGTERGQSKAVVIAIENVEDVLNRAGGSMFNTVHNGFTGTSDLVEINISFANSPLSTDQISSSSFNFFLIKNQERGTEIHLANRKPTSLMTYPFGESADTSVPNNDRYYKTKNNLPWGLLILESFKHPIEQVPLNEAYPQFIEWAESQGNVNTSWFKNPSPSKIW